MSRSSSDFGSDDTMGRLRQQRRAQLMQDRAMMEGTINRDRRSRSGLLRAHEDSLVNIDREIADIDGTIDY